MMLGCSAEKTADWRQQERKKVRRKKRMLILVTPKAPRNLKPRSATSATSVPYHRGASKPGVVWLGSVRRIKSIFGLALVGQCMKSFALR